jgi:phage tail-like protein
MSGQRTDPYKNYNFLVEIDNVKSAGFSICIIPDASVDVIEYREGGDAVTGVRKLPGRVKYSNLVLKRGMTDSQDLWTWFNNVVTGVSDTRQVTVILQDDTRNPVIRWTFYNAWPTKYESSPLQGKGNEVAIETLEIAHERMELSQAQVS